MHILDHDLPERNIFNFVLGFVVVIVVAYAGYLNYAQYQLISELKAGLCDQNCIKQIIETRSGQNVFKMDQLERPIAAADSTDLQIDSPKPIPTKLVKPSITKSMPYESSKSLSDGSVASTDWKPINSEIFGFDIGLYPTGSVVTYEGWLTLTHGADKGYVRLYDVTNNRMVDGSEMTVAADGRGSFYSRDLSIWRGYNQYRLEARSDTGYPVSVDNVRLVIKKM